VKKSKVPSLLHLAFHWEKKVDIINHWRSHASYNILRLTYESVLFIRCLAVGLLDGDVQMVHDTRRLRTNFGWESAVVEHSVYNDVSNLHTHQLYTILVLCEYSNRIVTSVFDSIRNKHNYSKFLNTYRHQFLTYLTEWRRLFALATTPSNQQNQQTWSRLHRQCRLKTHRLVRTIQIWFVLYAISTSDDNYSIRCKTSNNSWTIRFDSKWKNTIRTALH